MTTHIQEIFWENRRRYGSRRVQKALLEDGIELGRHRIRRLMEQHNWQAIQPRSRVGGPICSPHYRFKSRLATLPQFIAGTGRTYSA